MKIKKVAIFLLFILVTSSSCGSQNVISKGLSNNPTSYIFKINIHDACVLLEKSCNRNSSFKFNIRDLYYHHTSKKSSWPQAAKTALAGEAHKYDAWMKITVDSSDIYFNKKGQPLEYLMECNAHFTSIDSNTTRMEIKVLNAKIRLRDQLLPSPPHFVNNPVYKAVKPTTIEEYKILQCFGKGLGVINQMPALKS